MKKIMFMMCVMLSSSTAFALDLHGIGHDLTADGGVDAQLIAIQQHNTDYVIESQPMTCTGDLRLENVQKIGSVMADGQLLSVWNGNGNVGFGLHYKTAGSWQALTEQHIPCQAGQSLTLKATFYRQSNSTTNALTQQFNQQLTLTDGTTNTPIHVNATLNFKRLPMSYSCKVQSSTTHIQLDKVSAQALNEKYRIQNGTTATVGLDCNSANAKVLMMVYDNLDKNNWGAGKTALSLKPSKESATGVGVELYYQGKILSLGQQVATTPLVFDETYVPVYGGEQRTLSLNAGYVKTGEISTGKVEAQAGLVFVYP